MRSIRAAALIRALKSVANELVGLRLRELAKRTKVLLVREGEEQLEGGLEQTAAAQGEGHGGQVDVDLECGHHGRGAHVRRLDAADEHVQLGLVDVQDEILGVASCRRPI